MKNKQTSLESKIRLLVPNNLLRLFDKAIPGTFPSRNEAIRRGMQLVIEEIEQINAQNGKNSPRSHCKQLSERNASRRAGRDGRDWR